MSAPRNTDESAGVVPKPSLTHTYKWANGDDIGDYSWATDDDWFLDEISDSDEPKDMLIETWERTGYEVRTLFPPLYTCSYEDDEPCEEDAVVWQHEDGGKVWMQACEGHRQDPFSGRSGDGS